MGFNDFIGKLNEINNNNLISIHVPSAGREIKFKQLSVKQQKDLIKTSLDGKYSGLAFSNVLSDIILENSTEKHSFLVTDKFPIILALRKCSYGPKFVEKDGESEKEFDLNKILTKELKFSEEFSVALGYENQIVVYADVVSLDLDKKVNDHQINLMKKNKDEDISESIGDIFILELVKFITKIIIGDNSVDFSQISIKERISIVEKLPVPLNNLILDYIQSFRKPEIEYLTVDGNTLPIDARLFAKE